MSKNNAINVFDLENSYSAGGYFQDGLYRIEASHFSYFDFNNPGQKSLVMRQDLQPLNKDGEKEGALATQYWSLMAEDKDTGKALIEPITPVKGVDGAWSQVRITEANTKDKIFGGAPFKKYMEYLQKTGYDMDSAGNDITALEGLVAEFGKHVEQAKAKTKIQEAEEGATKGGKKQKETYETIVIVNIPKQGKGAVPAAKKDTAKEEKAPATKKGKDQTPEEVLTEALDEFVCIKANKGDGVVRMSWRLELANWLTQTKGLDADATRSVMKIYNDEDKLGTILKTLGWKVGGKADKYIVFDED